MKNIILILSNWKYYRYWCKIKRGVKTIDYVRGCGYYLLVGSIGQIEEYEMRSGKMGMYELIDYNTFRDPWDMVEKSYWHFLGYKGEKLIKEMDFKEFLTAVKS